MVSSNIEMGRHRDLSKRKKTTQSSPAAPPSTTTTTTHLGALPFPPPPPTSQPQSDPRPSAPSDTQSRASRLPTSSHTPSREQSTTCTSEAAPTIGSETSKRRMPVYLRGKFLEPSGTCSRLIRGIIEERIDFKGYNWKAVSKETKDFYFEEFRKNCIWDEAIETWIKRAWNTKASRRYGDMVCDAKTSKKRPTFINQETWQRWQRYWNTARAKNISKIYSDNRMKHATDGKGPSTHTGVNITHHKHGERLDRQLGRKPTAQELHLHTHTKNHNGKTFTNAKSKQIHDTFTSKLEELTQANETIDENKLYLDVVGGENRNGVFGLGYEACEYYGSRPPTSFQSGQQNSEEINELRQRIIQQDEDIKNLKDLTERLLQRIDGMSGTQPPPQHEDDDDEDDDDDESATV